MTDDYTQHALLLAELDLRRQQGAEPGALAQLRRDVDEWRDSTYAEALWQRAAALPTVPDLIYDEPSDWPAIAAQIAGAPSLSAAPLHDAAWLTDRLLGGLAGRFAGCMLGKPLEIPWTPDQIRAYLQRAGAYPLRDYVPLLDPFPEEDFPRPAWHTWNETTLGNLDRVVRDDDVDFTLAGWQILQRHGADFTTADVGAYWLENLPYHRVYTAERCAYRNLVNGLSPPPTAVSRNCFQTATHHNPYREWIGAQIRADAYGYACPGRPARAAELAWRDAALSHTRNGIYGAMWVAAMVAAAFVLDDARAVVEAGLAHIPPRSRLAEALRDVLRWSAGDGDWRQTLQRVRQRYGAYYRADEGLNWIHTIPNACLVALSLLHGAGDYGRAITIAVMGGWDTDCNGASAGSVAGVMSGGRALPASWVQPLNDTIESVLPGCQGLSISGLARSFAALAQTLSPGAP